MIFFLIGVLLGVVIFLAINRSCGSGGDNQPSATITPLSGTRETHIVRVVFGNGEIHYLWTDNNGNIKCDAGREEK